MRDQPRVYDLSVPVADGVDWYNEPITPPVRVEDIGDMAAEGWVSHVMTIAPLNGTTYMETSAHLVEGGQLLDDLRPERFLCRAYIVRPRLDGQEILAPAEPLEGFRRECDAILVHTGWDVQMNKPGYYSESPYFSELMRQWLLDHQPSILGGDMLSYDHPESTGMSFLAEYFRRGGVILCPLVGMGELPFDVGTLCAAPMKLTGVNCAPCRALIWADANRASLK